MRPRQRILVRAIVGACALVLAGTASGQTTIFPMAGSWAQNRGNLIDLPVTGDKPCAINPETNPPFVMGGFGRPLRAAAAGCIPGSGTVMVSGPLVVPRSFMLTGVTRNDAGPAPFHQPGAAQNAVALTLVPHIVQLATSYTLRGPGSVSITTPDRPTPFPSGKPTGTFMKSAFLTQTGRAGPDFGWCPGGATQNPSCTTPTPAINGAAGTYNGLVRYSAGPNAFGGTMTMLVQGTGSISYLFQPGPDDTPRVIHLPVGATIGAIGAQHPGGAFANSARHFISSGTVKQSPVYTSGGLIGSSQTPDPTVMAGATTILSYGFPWTTGQVYVRNTDSDALRPATTTFTATGSDMRGPDGQGVITMVAGGVSFHLRRAGGFSSVDVVRLRIGSAQQAPASSPASIAAGAALMLLAVAYARRRRF